MTIRWGQFTWVRALFFLSCSCGWAQVTVLDYMRDGRKAFDSLPVKFAVKRVRLRFDAVVDQEQIRSLIRVREGRIVTREDLAQACFYLTQLGRFKTIQLLVEPGANGYSLTLRLLSQWVFARLSIAGVWFGKDEIRKRYTLVSGEPFDQGKHAQSVKKIVSYYHKHGYLNAVVTDVLQRDSHHKLVNVSLKINTGRICTIAQVCVVCSAVLFKEKKQQEQWLEPLRLLIQRSLLHRAYKKDRVKQAVADAREWLAYQGFPFASIQAQRVVERGSVSLTFIVEVTAATRVVFSGNQAYLSAQLIKYALYDEGRLLDSAMPLFAHRILEFYKKQGYLRAQVVPTRNQHWVLTIHEGPRVHLQQVTFLGVDQSRLTYVQKIADAGIPKGITGQDDVAALMKKIVDWYAQRGFWDARINDKKITDDTRGRYTLQLTMHEGTQRMLKGVRIPDYSRLESVGPFALVYKLKQPIPFNQAFVEEQRRWLAKQLAKEGVHVRALEPQLQEESDGVVVTWQVHRDDAHTIMGRVVVTGMPHVATQRLLADCACYEGKPLDMQLLEKTFYNLRELGIFSELSVRPSLQRDERGQTPIVVRAVADDPFELQARIGGLIGNSNRSSTYVLGASAWWKNPTGQADTLRLDINATRFNRDIVAGYGFPRVAGFPVRLALDVFDKKYDHLSYGPCRRTLYRAFESGGKVGFTYRNDPFILGLALGYSSLKINVIDDAYARAICFEPSMSGKRQPYFFIDPYFECNYVDEKLNPSSGVMSAAQVTFGIPLYSYADQFVRLLLKQSIFMPFGSWAVLALQGQVGHVIMNSFKRLLPSQRFYLGGACSVRSYQGQAADPVSCYHEGNTAFFVPVGSASMGLLSAELRLPLTQNLSVALFQDFGVLKGASDGVWYPASATGGGIRYRTPVGPLRFDIAWKAKKSKADCVPFAWYLTLGQAF